MVENGIKPVYVFDGKPPVMKAKELEKRSDRRTEAEAALAKAKEEGNDEEIDKQSRRLVRVSKVHVDECKQLLKLMGIPFVSAPCEAEAQCAELVKSGKVYAVGTEDMDALTFGTAVLLRHMTFSEARKMPIKEFHLDKLLSGIEMDQKQFIDLCILLGCDYCDKIRGVGPKTALKLVQEHKDIETIIKKLQGSKKEQVPDGWMYAEARRLFVEPEVTPADDVELKWEQPDEEALVKFMCESKGFAEERIRNGAKKLLKARQGSTQGRLDSFFKVLPSPTNGANKRKSDDAKLAAAKKTRGSGGGKKGFFKR